MMAADGLVVISTLASMASLARPNSSLIAIGLQNAHRATHAAAATSMTPAGLAAP